MSHVDEGTLHAYLDGALDAVLPAGEAARVRQHLEVCDVCAARLQEERELREEAAVILGLSAPSPGELPSFEALRARAEADTEDPVSRRPRGASIRRLAWAASVVLAVGAGWLLRGASAPRLPGSPGRVELEAQREGGAAPGDDVDNTVAPERAEVRQAAAPPAEEAAGSGAAAKGASASAPGGTQAPGVTVDESVVVAKAGAPATEGKAGERKGDTAESEVAFPALIPAPEPLRRAVGQGLAARPPANALDSLASMLDSMTFPRTVAAAREATAPSSREWTLAPPQRPSAPVQAAGAASRAVADATRRSDASPAMKAVTATETRPGDAPFRVAAASGEVQAGQDPATLAVPDLTVLSVVRFDAGEVAGAVRVRQLLASGDTLEIVHLPPGVRPSALPPVPEGETELVVVRGDGWLVLRARASRDVLDDVARRLASPR